MPRNRPAHYVGATKAIARRELAGLGPGFALQPKIDGAFCRVYCDGRGRIAKVFMRNGREFLPHMTSHLIGALVAAPYADLAGEIEALTESGEAAAKLGPRKIHIFDALFDGTRSLINEPYRVRRDALWRMQSAVQCAAPDDDHRPAPCRRYRAPTPPGWRLTPIVPQVAPERADWAWDAWVNEVDGEGLVAVALEAKAGTPNSKLKSKPWETIDARVEHVSRTTVVCSWNGHLFKVGRGKHIVDPGEIVEVRHAGWAQCVVLPRCPVLVRVRRDLQ